MTQTQLLKVSIPIWCDWKYLDQLDIKAGSTVSIPIWCDWKRSGITFVPLVVMFQFLYGAIGSKYKLTALYSSQMFQFLYGAIGRVSEMASLAIANAFQFLYGAIGSYEVYDPRLEDLSFNSYMVRLEVCGVTRVLPLIVCFNSYMVRLEVQDPDWLR